MSEAPDKIALGDSGSMKRASPSHAGVSSLDLPGGSLPPTAAGHFSGGLVTTMPSPLMGEAGSDPMPVHMPRAAADVEIGEPWVDLTHRTIAEIEAAGAFEARSATRRPSVTVRAEWRPKGPNAEPAFGIHVRLVFSVADGVEPHAVYLTTSRSAAKHGSELHARCEEIGMLVSWCLQRGMSLAEMEAQFKPVSPEGGQGLGLFAVVTALALAAAP